MGTLTYDSTLAADFDDRTLAHLQVVIGAKLRRNEAFFFSWKDDNAIGDGRSVIWVHPSIPISFKFFGSRPPALNREWVDEMLLLANTPSGLHITPEPSGTPANGGIMTRTTILYDGAEYVVAATSDEVRAKIDSVLATGKPGWITVNHGRGKLQPAELLVSVGIPISLIDTSDPE